VCGRGYWFTLEKFLSDGLRWGAAGLETGDTADSEVCATSEVRRAEDSVAIPFGLRRCVLNAGVSSRVWTCDGSGGFFLNRDAR
jgi:hypothetical protein